MHHATYRFVEKIKNTQQSFRKHQQKQSNNDKKNIELKKIPLILYRGSRPAQLQNNFQKRVQQKVFQSFAIDEYLL